MKHRLDAYFLFTVIVMAIIPFYATAEMYSYVDENGNTQYTNVVPPQIAKGVKKSKEIEVDQVTVQERLEQKYIETQDSYEWKKEQQHEAEQLAIEKREEQNEINLRIQEEKREQKRKNREEKKYMLSKQKNWLSKCNSMKVGFLIIKKYRDRVKKRTKQDLRLLTKTSKSYFVHK